MRAVITGAGGFCGRHLSRYLEGMGVEVHTLGTQAVRPNQHVIDPSNVASVATAIAAAKPDYVFHLAGVAVVEDYDVYYRANTLYAVVLLSALKSAGLGQVPVLLVGTSAEYGRVTNADLPITEAIPACPYNHYGTSKLAQTLMGSAVARTGRPIIMVRPFNIIGPGMPNHLALPSFAQQLLEIVRSKRPAIIDVGNLNTSRDFIDIEDVIEIYWRLINNSEAYGQIINVCSGEATSLRDLLSKLVSIAGIRVDVRSDPDRFKSVDVANHYGSCEKLLRLLDYTPRTSLDTSLTRIWNSLAKI